ncbi:MAG: translation elongation factor [Frankiales bacterium]|nr:translation elongation factor [Frankiales bacterium]
MIATAGHVDHGKSTLVRALTGMEPDRWAEERRRGMTIDLGFAWTTLDDGEQLAFVDVPGHHRFLSNMLAGVGPAPAVLFVVSADEGWRRQSEEHLAAVDALGIRTGLLAVTRSDLADPAPALAQARQRIARSGLGEVAAVPVSGLTGQGLGELRAALARTVATLPPPRVDGPVRLWVDRAFTVAGSGTVVTATLDAGAIEAHDTFELRGRAVSLRNIQALGQDVDRVEAVSRVALNLRGVARAEVGRGDALLTPGGWQHSASVDCHCTLLAPAESSGRREPVTLTGDLVLHLGSSAVAVRARVLGDDLVRLQLARPLPVRPGDRAVLRDPGRQQVVAAVRLLDVDPPPLTRRGAAKRRVEQLEERRAAESRGPGELLRLEVARRGFVQRGQLVRLGIPLLDTSSVREVGDWLIDNGTWTRWRIGAAEAVAGYLADHPAEPGLSVEELRQAIEVPDRALLAPLLADAGLQTRAGRAMPPGYRPRIEEAERAFESLRDHLRDRPFAAPERGELDQLGLGPRELAVLAAAGRIVRLSADIVLLADAPARARAELAELAQPFSTSQARIALGATRRVTIPLLEFLDEDGATRRLDGTLREVLPPS